MGMTRALAAALVLAMALPGAAGDRQGAKRSYKMGLGGIPFDLTPEAVGETQKFIHSHSDMMVVNLKDDGIPWEAAAADQPFPGLEEKWKEGRAGVPAGYKVFLSLTPLNGDKNDLGGAPDSLRGKPFDDKTVIRAYSNYCRRAVSIYRPDWVSIAQECTGVAHSKPKSWDAFVRLCSAVRQALKKDAPRTPVGVSHDLSLLWNQQIAKQVKPSLREIDFLGVQFLPFIGLANERTGGRALPTGKAQWAEPLKFLRRWSDVPIAITDTAYTTKEVVIPVYEIKCKGDPQIQKDYLTALLEQAEADKYLFVVWSVAIDPEKLLANLPSDLQAFLKIVQNVGLLDGQLKPKPALDVWDRELLKNPKPQ